MSRRYVCNEWIAYTRMYKCTQTRLIVMMLPVVAFYQYQLFICASAALATSAAPAFRCQSMSMFILVVLYVRRNYYNVSYVYMFISMAYVVTASELV